MTDEGERKREMNATTLKEWKKEIAKRYSTDIVYVVPENSFAAKGAGNVGRLVFARVKSPWGGWYKVFGRTTAATRMMGAHED